jgi:hypothetical protein
VGGPPNKTTTIAMNRVQFECTTVNNQTVKNQRKEKAEGLLLKLVSLELIDHILFCQLHY